MKSNLFFFFTLIIIAIKFSNNSVLASTNITSDNDPFFSIIVWVGIFIFFLYRIVDDSEMIKKYKQRQYEENIIKNRILQNIPEIKIPFDAHGVPKQPQLQHFSLNEEQYNFVNQYEQQNFLNKYAINLPDNYYAPKGLYFRYTAYNIAINLYNQEIIKYKVAQEQKLKQKKEYWVKYWQNSQQNGLRFENDIGKLYRTLGYNVKITKGSGDGGVDLILKKNGITTIVQCKAHKHQVGPNDVRALWGVREDFNATHAIFIAYSGVTKGAQDFARGKNLELLNVHDLIRMSIELYTKDT